MIVGVGMSSQMNARQMTELALQHLRAGRWQQAEQLYRQALAANPADHAALNNLGTALKKQGRLPDAIAVYRQALALRPDFVEAYNNMGNALRANEQIDEAIAAFRQAVALRPQQAEVLNHLGMALSEKQEYDESAQALRKALAIRPDFSDAWYNLGCILFESGQHVDSAEAYRQAVAIRPDFWLAKMTLGMSLMRQGNFEQGLPLLETRWKVPGPDQHLASFANSRPMWDGSNPGGRTLLIHAEQGFGDVLQFIRYVPLAAERGARVILACQPELKRLAGSVGGFFHIAQSGEQIPLFDMHCPMMSLPFAFGTRLGTIPTNVPYLKADSALSARWQQRLAPYQSELKVGLCWSGRSTSRQFASRVVTLNALAPLAQVAGVRFFSLQKGDPSAQARQPPPGMELIDWTNEFHDFADTAALIENLDLIIASDTSVAHLAGSLGKKVWTMLKFAADWRWLLDRSDTPWYPTMRLFRQPKIGDWQSVIDRVREELNDLPRE